MGDALLEQINDMAQTLFAQPAALWETGVFTAHDRAVFERECSVESEFDELRSRQRFHSRWKAGLLEPLVRTTKYGKVIAFLEEPGQAAMIPWTLWSRIFQRFARPDGRPYTVFVCAHPSRRTLPSRYGEATRPRHINGGYTYPCDPTCVVVYRAEDATRVLLHELLHAACTDRKGLGLEEKEAETEAWAELFWCALMASGDLKACKSLVRRQSAWMRGQNRALLGRRHFVADGTATPFPWRYTIGKEAVWQRWGLLDTTVAPLSTRSLRLTVPPSQALQKKFEVPEGSVFL
jgi:hypothetical protein